jgi:serine/threonine protein kinase
LKSEIPEQDAVLSRKHLIEAISREAISLAVCDHPQIPGLVEYLWIDDRPCIVMHQVFGETLSKILAARGVLGWNLSTALVNQILEILSYLHERGWLHCDLNPGNILLGDGDRVCLIDFGAAQRIGLPPFWQWPLGRHRFMGPEHLNGRFVVPPYRELGPSSDLYQVACLFIFLLTGRELFRSPFENESYADYLIELGQWMELPTRKKLADIIESLDFSDVPDDLIGFFDTALNPRPENRFRTAGAMGYALSQYNRSKNEKSK